MDERRNASYCMDMTAYEAIKNIERQEQNMDIMRVGEIWECSGNKILLILAVHEKVCNALLLTDEKKVDSDIEVIGEGMQYTNPCMIQYKYKNTFERFIRKVPDDEFKYIQNRVGDVLGFTFNCPNDCSLLEEKVKSYEEEIKKRDCMLQDAYEVNEDLRQALTSRPYSEDIIRVETERDLYKKQAEDYFERLLER